MGAFVAHCEQVVVCWKPGSADSGWFQSIDLKSGELSTRIFLLNQVSWDVLQLLFSKGLDSLNQLRAVPNLYLIVVFN